MLEASSRCGRRCSTRRPSPLVSPFTFAKSRRQRNRRAGGARNAERSAMSVVARSFPQTTPSTRNSTSVRTLRKASTASRLRLSMVTLVSATQSAERSRPSSTESSPKTWPRSTMLSSSSLLRFDVAMIFTRPDTTISIVLPGSPRLRSTVSAFARMIRTASTSGDTSASWRPRKMIDCRSSVQISRLVGSEVVAIASLDTGNVRACKGIEAQAGNCYRRPGNRYRGPALAEVAGRRRRRALEAHFRRPEPGRHEVHDAAFGLQLSAYTKEGSGLGQHRKLVDDRLPEDDVDEARLVFEGHEDDPFGRARALAADDDAREFGSAAIAAARELDGGR